VTEAHHETKGAGLRFGCGSIVAGACAFVTIRPGMDALESHVARTLLIAGIAGVVAARYGDRAWKWISRVIPWT
jgi:hypothetical protein